MNRKLNRKDARRIRSKNSYKKPRGRYNKTAKFAQKLRFLTARQLGATIAQAAQMIDVGERTVYDWRERDPEFAKAWDIGPDYLIENIEAGTFRSAIQGDRQLRMFLLKAHKPATYHQRPQQPKADDTSKLLKIAEVAEKVRGWF